MSHPPHPAVRTPAAAGAGTRAADAKQAPVARERPTRHEADSEVLAVRRVTGALLIVVSVAFTVIFVALGSAFDYPDILDAPTGEVLRQFADGGDGLIALWYAFMLTAVLFVPIAVLLPRALGLGGALGAMSVTLGVLAGVVQFVGLARWPFLVPYLSDTYADPQATPATREAAGVTFQAFHRFAGGGLGEHLGYLFTAAWTLLLSEGLHRVLRRPWIAGLGAASALGIAAGMLEPLGVEAAGTINAVAYTAFALWLIIVGIVLLRGPGDPQSPAATGGGRGKPIDGDQPMTPPSEVPNGAAVRRGNGAPAGR